MGPGAFQAGRSPGGIGESVRAGRERGEGSAGRGQADRVEGRRGSRGKVLVSPPYSLSQIAAEERQLGETYICHGLSPNH